MVDDILNEMSAHDDLKQIVLIIQMDLSQVPPKNEENFLNNNNLILIHQNKKI